MNPYALMLKASEILGLPLQFKTDLTKWDKGSVASDPSPFVWVVYEGGTHLMRPGNRHPRKDMRKVISSVREALEGYQPHWFIWDGHDLWLVLYDKAEDFYVGRKDEA